MSERRGNPFGWILLGFIVGVLATFGTILFLTAGGGDGYEDGPSETRTAADDAATAAMSAATSSSPVPHKVEAVAPAAVQQPLEPARPERPATAPQTLDPQVADDAAAAGMTSRTR